jgi:diadenosine tetraphosphate (Ap4A) HIT family hydrolase
MTECDFCQEFAEPPQGGRIVWRRAGWVLLPTIGCFTEGYSLLMPERHLDAAADADPAELVGVEESLEEARALIAGLYGPVIVGEHGASGCDLGAGCCSHAHLHLIPVPSPQAVHDAYRATGSRAGSGGRGRRIGSLAELPGSIAGPYVSLSPRPGEHWVWPSRGFERQYVRRITAAQHQVADQYDWRDHPFPHLQDATLRRLREAVTTAHE